MTALSIENVRFTCSTPADAARGLLGYVSFVVSGVLRLDGVTVRKSLGGSLVLSWPARTDSRGERHPYVHPISTAAREGLEREIFAALPFSRERR